MKNHKILRKRIFVLEILVGCFFVILFYFLYHIIYTRGVFYQQNLKNLTEVIVEGESAPRGRIYDRNYNLLVDNIAVPVIYYQKEKKITVKEEIQLAYEIGKHLDIDVSKLHIRNLKEFYLLEYPKKGQEKITTEEYEKLKRRELSSKEIEELKILNVEEKKLSKKMLTAAALTYVASVATAVLEILRLILIANSRNDD